MEEHSAQRCRSRENFNHETFIDAPAGPTNLETHVMSALDAPASYEPASTLVQRIDANHADSARGP